MVGLFFAERKKVGEQWGDGVAFEAAVHASHDDAVGEGGDVGA